MKITRDFLETIINYQHCVGKDETRPTLETVALIFSEEDSKVYASLYATDGHKAIRSKHLMPELGNFQFKEWYLIPKDLILEIKNLLKENKLLNQFILDLRPDNILSIETEDHQFTEIKLLQRDYVRIESLFELSTRKAKNPIEEIAFNPDYIADIRKAVYSHRKVYEQNHPNLKFHFGINSNDTLRCTITYQDITHEALLCPMDANNL